jgi:acetyltransferase-like isoleucine patch superfamily enzyme
LSSPVSLIKHTVHAYRRWLLEKSCTTVGSDCGWNGSRPRISNLGSIELGNNVQIRSMNGPVSLMTTKTGAIRIGARTFVNSAVFIYSNSAVTIGEGCLIGNGCYISDFPFHAVHCDQSPLSRLITIGRNIWLGEGSFVMPGVTIGDHSVVAARSVVFEDIPASQLWRGNPATFYKNVRSFDGFERV